MTKKALVTGGCGFIGSNLVKELVNQGWAVDVVDNMSNGDIGLIEGVRELRVLPNASFLHAYKQQDAVRTNDKILVIEDDFSSLGMLMHINDEQYDVVFHQAAVPRVSYSVENPAETTNENITKTVALFEACIGAVDRVVFASSSSIYGGADELPTKETQLKAPKSPYAWQKSAIEDFASIVGDLYELDVVCLRYFNVFGPGQYGDGPYATAVAAWCNAVKNGKPCRSDGDGTQSRDLCYVDNVVNANILAANSSATFNGKCYNIACGDRTSNNEILSYFKKNFDVVVNKAPWRPGDVMHTQADITAAKEELGYEPIVRFWEGLEKTVEWWNINE
jgi:UDP-glucose 4-epimerase